MPHVEIEWRYNAFESGCGQARTRDERGIFRVMYVAGFKEADYVQHCFQKKTPATSKQDKEIAAKRYAAVIKRRWENL